MIGVGLAGHQYLGDFTEPGYFRAYPGLNISVETGNRHPFDAILHVGFGRFAEQFDTVLINSGNDNNFVETLFYYGDLRLRFRPFVFTKVQPFISIGAGLMLFSPRDADGFPLVPNGNNNTSATFNTIIPQLPGSAGVLFRLNDRFKLSASYTYRFTPSDYLDNFQVEELNTGFDALHSVMLVLHISLGTLPELPIKN